MNFFDRTDNYFYNKTKKDFVYIILLIVFLIGFVFFYLIYPAAEKYKNTQMTKYQNLSTQIQQLRVKFNVYNAKITLLSRKAKEEQNRLNILIKKKVFYTELANLLDFAEFDQYKWANIVKDTVQEAKNKGMAVKSVTNKTYNVDIKTGKKMPDIVKRMDIGINLTGKYKNFIYYLYNYENKKELIRVKEMNITSPSQFYVKFSVYGYDK